MSVATYVYDRRIAGFSTPGGGCRVVVPGGGGGAGVLLLLRKVLRRQVVDVRRAEPLPGLRGEGYEGSIFA